MLYYASCGNQNSTKASSALLLPTIVGFHNKTKNNKIDPNNVQFLSISHDVFQNEYTFAEVLIMNMFKAVFFGLIVKQNPAPGS